MAEWGQLVLCDRPGVSVVALPLVVIFFNRLDVTEARRRTTDHHVLCASTECNRNIRHRNVSRNVSSLQASNKRGDPVNDLEVTESSRDSSDRTTWGSPVKCNREDEVGVRHANSGHEHHGVYEDVHHGTPLLALVQPGLELEGSGSSSRGAVHPGDSIGPKNQTKVLRYRSVRAAVSCR